MKIEKLNLLRFTQLLLIILFWDSPSLAQLSLSASIKQAQGKAAVLVSTITNWQSWYTQKPSSQTYGVKTLSPQDLSGLPGRGDFRLLDNEYFNVVQGESNETVNSYNFSGMNTFFHLVIARDHYLQLSERSGFSNPALNNKIIVRIGTDHAYNLVTHFAEIEDHNNSRYIPPNFAGMWGAEIWFAKPKAQLEKIPWFALTSVAAQSILQRNLAPVGILGSIELVERYNAGIDATKQPSVIYHEAFHWATDADGWFPMAADGNPVAEDYANYFGSSLNGRPVMADVDEFTSRFYLRNYSSISEVTNSNPKNYNSIEFVPSLFWKIRGLLGQERADQLIWNSMHWLQGSSYHIDIPKAVIAAAEADHDLSQDEVVTIRELFSQYQTSFVKMTLKFHNKIPQANPDGNNSVAKPPSTSPPSNELGVNSGVNQTPDPATNTDLKDKKTSFFNYLIKKISNITTAVLGFVGKAVVTMSSVISAPISFGADLITGTIYGHGLISNNEDEAKYQIAGSLGGVATMGEITTNAGATVLSFISAANAVGIMGTLVNTVICKDSDPRNGTQLDQYCTQTNQIASSIALTTARAGASVGIAIHSFFVGKK